MKTVLSKKFLNIFYFDNNEINLLIFHFYVFNGNILKTLRPMSLLVDIS